MKKFCLTLLLIFGLTLSVLGMELQGGVDFDWVNIPQAQRDAEITAYHGILFDDGMTKTYAKQDFKREFANYLKDKQHQIHYAKARAGVKETRTENICAFYYKKDVLIIYAIQYKDNLKNIYYYDGFGKLRYVDIISDEYPNFPYTSKQYDQNGKLISAIFFKSHDMQYMYEASGEFKGLWYKSQMYDRNGKPKATRNNWEI